jgi:hypothetical protein
MQAKPVHEHTEITGIKWWCNSEQRVKNFADSYHAIDAGTVANVNDSTASRAEPRNADPPATLETQSSQNSE